ncbi:MAG TPA: DUF1707 domain-containing protein [Streptosporangiaceae bacterium]|nr:DUF1707 domain-containing protein [Streptosporangiaceae bacterium]
MSRKAGSAVESYPSRYPSGNPRRYPAAHMRVSDADRDAALAELSEHYQAGRLNTEEMEERSAKALAAKTGSDLTGLLADLPPTGVAAPKAPPERRSRGGWAAASTAALALVAVLALILGVVIGHDHHGAWVPWWIIPVAFIVLRRMTWGHRHHHDHHDRDSDHRIDRHPDRRDPGELR